MNGDGYADLAIGARAALDDTGRVYVYLGSAIGVSPPAASMLIGPDGMLGLFGHSLASAGDLDGDDRADLVVGALWVNQRTGRAYVYMGSATGVSLVPAPLDCSSCASDDQFGVSVAGTAL